MWHSLSSETFVNANVKNRTVSAPKSTENNSAVAASAQRAVELTALPPQIPQLDLHGVRRHEKGERKGQEMATD